MNPTISIDYEGDCTCPNDHSHGELDEFFAEGVDVHFEMMDQCEWWIGITDPRCGRSWSIRCGSVSGRAKGYSSIEEEKPPERPPALEYCGRGICAMLAGHAGRCRT